jgi:hypothetical protein
LTPNYSREMRGFASEPQTRAGRRSILFSTPAMVEIKEDRQP